MNFDAVYKHKSIILLSVLLVLSTSTAFLNTKKYYPSIRFPSFSSFTKNEKTPIVRVTIYNHKNEKIDLRKAMKPFEIHQYNYIIFNLMLQERRHSTALFLEKKILKHPITLKVDTLNYIRPK